MATMNRRELVTGGAVAAMAAGALASTAIADEAAADGRVWDDEADIVVVGSGLGGMCAALEALDDGIENVLVVEISRYTGGGASLSRGRVHMFGAGTTEESFDKLTQYSCTSDLQHKVFSELPGTLDWIASHEGAPFQVEVMQDTPTGLMVDKDGGDTIYGPRNFFDWIEQTIVDKGGRFMMETAGRRLIMDDDNTQVIGVQCQAKDGSLVNIKTTQVVLACGDWKGDEEMRVRYLGHESNYAGIIGTPYNTGAGLKMATEVGAAMQGAMGQYAGAFIGAMPAKDWYADRENYEQGGFDAEVGGKLWMYATVVNHFYSGSDAIWVNNQGKRFCNETIRYEDKAVMDLPQSSFVAIFDSKAWDVWTKGAGNGSAETAGEQIEIITSPEVGGTYFSADTLEDLADQLNASGIAACKMHKANLVKTVAEYNEAVENGTTMELTPVRPENNCEALLEPPFYALPLRAAIFSNWGGVAIDTEARVVDCNRKPINGLYAAFPTAGGVIGQVYFGANACAAITGRMGARAAAEALGVK